MYFSKKQTNKKPYSLMGFIFFPWELNSLCHLKNKQLQLLLNPAQESSVSASDTSAVWILSARVFPSRSLQDEGKRYPWRGSFFIFFLRL